MAFNICALASGSKGNATLISSEKTKILIDAGISCRSIETKLKTLGMSPGELDAVILTHCHSDHIFGVKQIVNKYNLPIYTYYQNYNYLARAIGSGKNIVELNGNDFFVNEITVSPFELMHDVHCFGYSFYSIGKKITVMTDLGKITNDVLRSVNESDILMIESNHDIQKLMSNSKYSAMLKRRILSDKGHLSNDTCAKAIVGTINRGGIQIILAHLSQENNTPELAYTITAKALADYDIIVNKDVKVSVAMQNTMSEIFSVI